MTNPLQRPDGRGISREKTLAGITGVLSAVLAALVSFEVITPEQAAQWAAIGTPIVGSVWMWLFRTRGE